MVKLSIIIVNWNTTNYLKKCLESIFDNPPAVNYEVIVVDNNSDEDIVYLKDDFPHIQLIKNAFNYGFGIGNNIGFRSSSGEYVMAINPDTILMPGTIDQLLKTLEKNKEVAIAVPALKDQKVTKSQYTFFNLFFDSVIIRNLQKIFSTNGKKEEVEQFDVEYLNGTGYICRASVLTHDSLFREDNFLFGEEYYLCRQVTDKSYKIRVVPSARLEHHISVTFKNDPKKFSIAAKLGSAVLWKIRKDQWGRILGALGGMLLFLENSVKWAVLVTSGPFSQKTDAKRMRTFYQSKSNVLNFFPLLLNEKKFLLRINEKAEFFFNGGRKPEKPPKFSKVFD